MDKHDQFKMFNIADYFTEHNQHMPVTELISIIFQPEANIPRCLCVTYSQDLVFARFYT